MLLIFAPIRFIMGICDYHRVAECLFSKNCELLKLNWTLFGPGWWARGARIYEVSYSDDEGAIHVAYLKTSTWGGVYLSEDRIVSLSEKNLRVDAPLEYFERRKLDDEGSSLDFVEVSPIKTEN
ncbi:hypothetical protein [Roseibacillus persicicus]|nr:hypothetical protein [Roseibacillus persicicus]